MLSVQQFLNKNGMTLVSEPPYSPNLAPSNFSFLFSQMKNVLKRKCFANAEEVKQKMAEAFSIKIGESNALFSSGGKVLMGILHQMENT